MECAHGKGVAGECPHSTRIMASKIRSGQRTGMHEVFNENERQLMHQRGSHVQDQVAWCPFSVGWRSNTRIVEL